MGENVELEGSKWMKEAVSQNWTWMDTEGYDEDGEEEDDMKPVWIADVTKCDDTTRILQLTQTFKTFIGLHELQKTNTLCDITIKVEERSFRAHRVVLAAGSEYFSLMFTKSFQETCKPELTLIDAGNPEAFDVLLNFLYCGELKLSAENLTDVMEMSHYLQMDVAMKRCEHFVVDKINGITEPGIKLMTSILSAADMFDLSEVKQSCEWYLMMELKKPTEEFLVYVTLEKMEMLLKRIGLDLIWDEKEVFDTTVAWLQHDWDGRKDFAPQLFALIRLGAIPVGHLSMTLSKYPALYAIPECRERIERVMTLIDSAKPGDAPLHTVDYNLFATRSLQDGILHVNTMHAVTGSSCASFYKHQVRWWSMLDKFPELPGKYNNTNDSYGCLTLKGNLYIVRGVRDGTGHPYKCPRFLRLDTNSKKMLSLATMTETGRNPRDATFIPMPLRNQIVAIGGNSNSPCNVEMYDVEHDQWHKTNMSLQADGNKFKPMSGVVHDGNVLVYVRNSSHPTEHGLFQYILHPEQPCMTDCKKLLTENHPASNITGLVMNEGKCYRVAGGSCRCTTEGCQWHQVCVHALVIDVNSNTARVGGVQDQSVIPENFKKKNRAFRINSDVYVIHWKKFFKVERVLGSVGSESVELGNWSKLYGGNWPEATSVTAMLTFDPSAWHG